MASVEGGADCDWERSWRRQGQCVAINSNQRTEERLENVDSQVKRGVGALCEWSAQQSRGRGSRKIFDFSSK